MKMDFEPSDTLPIIRRPEPPREPPPVLTEVIPAQLVRALLDIIRTCDDHSIHTHDRVFAARMRAAEALRSLGLTPPPARSRTT